MGHNKKGQLVFLFLGVVVGLVVTLSAGVVLYKIKQELKRLKRYDAIVPEGVRSSDGTEVFVASSLDKVFQDGKTLVKPLFGKAATISMARNEFEAFQIVLHSGDVPLRGVTLQPSDLIDPLTKAQIKQLNLTYHVVGYVPTEKPYYPVKYVGYWPDPLLPQDKTDIQPNTFQSFWFSLYIPPETPAGNYDGLISVQGEGLTPKDIPVHVRVYNFALPKQSHLVTAFDFYGHILKNRYRQGPKESNLAFDARLGDLGEKFIVEMLKYRMNPVLNIDPTSQKDLGSIDNYRRFGLTRFSLGRRGGTFNNNWPDSDEEIEALLPVYRGYAEMLTMNKMFDMHYIYSWDEGPMGNPKVAKICSMIHRAHPGLKNMVCYHGIWDPDENPEWGKDIDIWTFQIDDFNEERMTKLQKLNKEIWMYISGPGSTGAPNLAIDFDAIDSRIVPWMCWKYKITGFLYWCVNWWTLADPFQSATNTQWGQNGNGLLYYPGPQGPLPSIRSEIYRDGMEDYEYLYLLKNIVQVMEAKQLQAEFPKIYEQAKKLLEIDPTLVTSLQEFNRDSNTLLTRRNQIAELIEESIKEFGNK